MRRDLTSRTWDRVSNHMRDITQKSMEYLRYILAIMLVFTLFFIVIQGNNNQDRTDRNFTLGKENNTYLRTMVCIASVSPTKRTPDYVKLCYLEAEKHNDTQVERFGDGI